jgi:hypothetical protein
LRVTDVYSRSATETSRKGYQVRKRAGAAKTEFRKSDTAATMTAGSEQSPTDRADTGRKVNTSLGLTPFGLTAPTLSTIAFFVATLFVSLKIPDEDLPGHKTESDEWDEFSRARQRAKEAAVQGRGTATEKEEQLKQLPKQDNAEGSFNEKSLREQRGIVCMHGNAGITIQRLTADSFGFEATVHSLPAPHSRWVRFLYSRFPAIVIECIIAAESRGRVKSI